MNQQEPQLSSHFGTPFLYQNGLKKPAHSSPIEITESYFNHTRTNLTIVKRNGLIVPLPSENTFGFEEKLGIRVEFRIKNGALAEIKKQLNLLDAQDDDALKLLRDAIENSKVSAVVGHVKIVLEYPLTLEELKKYGGTVYYAELDVVISTQSPSTVVPHPHSERGRRSNIATSLVGDKQVGGFAYSVFVVDSHGQYGPRFLNIGGKVYRVTPIVDYSQKDGVYVTSTKPADGDLFSPGEDIMHYSFEAAEESIGLFRTYDEAFNLGDLGTARKEQLASIEQENLVLQKDLTVVKNTISLAEAEHQREMQAVVAQHAREKLEIEERRAEIELTLKKQEEESDKRRTEMKDYYEHRSLNRKDTSEMVKILPAIVIGVGAVAALLFKVFGK